MSSRNLPANDACTVRLASTKDSNLLQVVLDASAGRPSADVYGLQADGLLDSHRVFLAFVADQPVGCVMATTSAVSGLHNLMVIPDQRGRGHGTSLIQAAMAANDEADCARVYWTAVDPAAEGAVERFHRLGFHRADDAGHGLALMIKGAAKAEGALSKVAA